MPPSPSLAVNRYLPIFLPTRDIFSQSAARSDAGVSSRLFPCSCVASRDSTSRRNSSSPAHASASNAARSLGVRSRAAWNSFSICCHRSAGILTSVRNLTLQPGFGKGPVAHYGSGRDLQDLGRLFKAQTAKETQFHYLAF